MKIYVFNNKGDKINQKIDLIYISDDIVITKEIGNIYNLYDYFINNNFDGDYIILRNFKNDKLEDIIKHISKYKKVDDLLSYNSIIISDKKRTRGLGNAKLD